MCDQSQYDNRYDNQYQEKTDKKNEIAKLCAFALLCAALTGQNVALPIPGGDVINVSINLPDDDNTTRDLNEDE